MVIFATTKIILFIIFLFIFPLLGYSCAPTSAVSSPTVTTTTTIPLTTTTTTTTIAPTTTTTTVPTTTTTTTPTTTSTTTTTTTTSTTTTTTTPLACATCADVQVLPSDIGGTDRPVTQTPGVDANGCATLIVSCTAINPTDQIVFFWFEQGADRGISQDTGTISRTLTCNAMMQLELFEPDTGATGIVDQVQCVSL